MFRHREDAGLRLAQKLKHRKFRDPVVLAIPCGGVVIGAILARELDAELDVVLARKLRAPGQPELSVGAIAEGGDLYLNHFAGDVAGFTQAYLDQERQDQLEQIAKLREVFRAVRPPANLTGRSVIVTDDGIATGSTMIAALRAIADRQPHEVIVAVPVASVQSSQSLEEIGRACNDFVSMYSPQQFWSIDQFYADFQPVSEEQVVHLLRAAGPADRPAKTAVVGIRATPSATMGVAECP
jgi:predicted phosphoribosyltransferase